MVIKSGKLLFLTQLLLSLLILSECEFEEMYRWKQITIDGLPSGQSGASTQGSIDIAFPDSTGSFSSLRSNAQKPNFNPYNNVPMGFTHANGKIIVTIPRRSLGIPVTLLYIPANLPKGSSPSFRPFPDYRTNELHPSNLADSSRIVSVYRTRFDVCNRLWFVDTGTLEYNGMVQIQRPSLWFFDMTTERGKRFEIPESIVQTSYGMASVTVDVTKNNCNDAYVYITDLVTFHLYVYSLRQDRIWRFTHNYFSYDPFYGDFNVVGLRYQWTGGIFSITLGRRDADGYRTAYFHSMASISEFVVNTRILQNETASQRSIHGYDFMKLGDRGTNGQSAMHAFDEQTGIIFYSQNAINGVGCWNSARPYTPQTQAILARNDVTMIYPSDLKLDEDGTLWIMTNSMIQQIYGKMDTNVYNFRIWKGNAREMARGTVCSLE